MNPTLALLGLALLLSSRTRPASDPTSSSRGALGILWSEGRLSGAESQVLARGGTVAKVIETDDRSEILTFAAVKVNTTSTRVLNRLRDVEGRRQEPWTRQIGSLANPPAAVDFAGLTLDADDVQYLSRCQLHRCELRLPAEAIESLRRELGATPPSSRADRASVLFRDLLARYTASYRARGNAALFYYVNNDDPVGIPASLAMLLARSQFLNELAPDVYAFLARYPAARPSGVEELTYWVKERFWLRDVLSLNHLTITDRSTVSGRLTLAVSKQLYATRYYESSLGVTACVEGPTGSYLVLVNRTRADIRPTGFTRIERLLLNYLVRRRLEARVGSLRAQLERPSAADERRLGEGLAAYQSIPMSPRVTRPTLFVKLP